jgi:hypothetical protein
VDVRCVEQTSLEGRDAVRPRVLAILVGVAIVGVAFAPLGISSTDAPAAGKRAAVAPATFRQLRVCAYEAFSIRNGVCTRDQRHEALTSTRLVCSVRVIAHAYARLRVQWTYDGQRLKVLWTYVHPGVQDRWMKLDSGGPSMAMPGGPISCDFSIGRVHSTAALISGGPTGRVVDIEVCSGAYTFHYGSFAVCRSDQGSAPIPAHPSIVCNGIFPNETGKKASVDIVAIAGSPAIPPGIEKVLDGPLVQWYREIPGDQFQPGPYECRFLLDGVVVGDEPFEISQ